MRSLRVHATLGAAGGLGGVATFYALYRDATAKAVLHAARYCLQVSRRERASRLETRSDPSITTVGARVKVADSPGGSRVWDCASRRPRRCTRIWRNPRELLWQRDHVPFSQREKAARLYSAARGAVARQEKQNRPAEARRERTAVPSGGPAT